jgi:DNA-binding MarR family transcriptional regulator
MSSKTTRRPSSQAQLLTDVILLIFRVNGQLLASGDRLVEDLKLTSARWQMLGAVVLSGHPRTAPELAARMGVTRQGAQKQLNLLVDAGLVAIEPNPGHARSPLYLLTRKGTSVYATTERVQTSWANQLAHTIRIGDLKATKQLLEDLSSKLSESDGGAR